MYDSGNELRAEWSWILFFSHPFWRGPKFKNDLLCYIFFNISSSFKLLFDQHQHFRSEIWQRSWIKLVLRGPHKNLTRIGKYFIPLLMEIIRKLKSWKTYSEKGLKIHRLIVLRDMMIGPLQNRDHQGVPKQISIQLDNFFSPFWRGPWVS